MPRTDKHVSDAEAGPRAIPPDSNGNGSSTDKYELATYPRVNPENGEQPTQLSLSLDRAAEARVRFKIDLYVVPLVALLYLFTYIDRANLGEMLPPPPARDLPSFSHAIPRFQDAKMGANEMPGNAKIAGLEKDLRMHGYDYNVTITVFYVAYIVFELPLVLLCKRMGPGWFLPLATILFGISSLATAFVQTSAQLMGVRFLLGVFEAGMFPGIAYFLSRWYRRAELAFRLSLYMVMAPLAGAFGGLLASAILTLRSFGSLHDWRIIFAVEGIVTIGVGLVALVILTDRPQSARWLSDDECKLAVARVESERLGSKMLDRMDRTKIVRGLFCPTTLGMALIFLCNNITVQGLAFFAPTIVKTIYRDRTVVQLQLLTAPQYVVGACFLLFFSYVSWRLDRRMVPLIMSSPLVMVGYIIFLATAVSGARYAATFLIASSLFVFGPLGAAHVAANVVTDTARGAAIGMNVMLGNVGGLVAGWSFLPWDAPAYHIGNGLNLAMASTSLVLAIIMWLWMKRDNRRRAARDVSADLSRLSGMSAEEIDDLDWKHPSFRWKT
ncbi:hypothetical protein E4U42_007794 [Claviceps africana]|uniref:Major facilitator superfamily (MFS) profile domain-containing protein n=1 Tax=Claviceps africana TaxID=83212 RepID=A0A8K0J1C1_9HYPO|nr:hypothetical protein E4U42_007794 [Claviceps africana]